MKPQMENPNFDSKGFRVVPQKLKDCEAQISKNNLKIVELEKQIWQFKIDKYHDPKSPEIQQKIAEIEIEVRKLQREIDVRKRCHQVNSGCFDVACPKCEKLPLTPCQVKRVVPENPGYRTHISGCM